MHFDIQPKAMLAFKADFPVAIGEPVLLLLVWGIIRLLGAMKPMRRGAAA